MAQEGESGGQQTDTDNPHIKVQGKGIVLGKRGRADSPSEIDHVLRCRTNRL